MFREPHDWAHGPADDPFEQWCEQCGLDPEADETINEWRGMTAAPDEPEINDDY